MAGDNILYGVVVPLQHLGNKAGFTPVDDLLETIRFNVKSTLFTKEGESLGDLSFGVGISELMFKNFEELQDEMPYWRNKIINQLHVYCPYLTVTGVDFVMGTSNINSNTLSVVISYQLDMELAQTFKDEGDLDGDGLTGEDDTDGETSTFKFDIGDIELDINEITQGTF